MNIPFSKSKSFLQFKSTKPPSVKISEFPTFLHRMSTLLGEGYTFAHCIEMLLPYHVKNYRYVQQEISETLHNGGSAVHVFHILGLDKQFLVSIELAEMTGNLQETVAIVAQQLTFQKESKSKLYKVLMYPVVLFVFLIFLFLAFRTYFLPNMASMVTSRANGSSSTSIQWSKFFLHMPDYFIGISILLGIAAGIFVIYVRKKRVDLQLSLLFRLPFIGLFWRLMLTRQFSRVLGNLILAGFSLQQALEHMKGQTHQKQLAFVSQILQERVIFGDTLAQSIRNVGYFYPKFDQFVSHGEMSGLLGRELILYCDLLNERLQSTIHRLLTVIQPLLFIIIALCVIAAYLSILIPMYDVMDFI